MRRAILTYHSLDDSDSVISTRPGVFRRHMLSLAERRIPVAPLDRVLDGEDALAITFDDGYRNFVDEALPILTELRFPAAVFVVTSHCGRVNSWDRAADVPALPLMDWDALRALPPGLVSLGSHGSAHLDLTRLTQPALRAELRESRHEIERQTGRAATQFAYPYGRWNQAVVEAARGEYALAVTTSLGYLPESPDPYRLPRIDAYYARSLARFRQVTVGRSAPYLGFRRALRNLKRSG